MSIHVWFDGPVYCIEGLVYTLSASLSGHKCYFDNRFVPDICCVFKAACIQFAKFTPLSLFSDVTSSRQWLNSTALQTLFYFLLHSQVFHISNDLLKICWEDKVFIKTDAKELFDCQSPNIASSLCTWTIGVHTITSTNT